MFRTSRTKPYSSALSLLTALAAATLVGLLCGLSPRAVQARAYTYGTGASRTVNAGILLLDNNTSTHSIGSENKDPYIFYILNQRTDIKPYGWSIVNPLAPAAVTAEIQSRWDARTINTPDGAGLVTANSGHAYQLGQTVTPAMAAYWEVRLSNTTIDNLKQFDVLLLNIDGNCQCTAADAEKLRRFVDGGGTLWVENSATSGANISTTASLFFQLQYSGTTPGGSSYAEYPYLTRSPIITSPYYLSQLELNTLGDKHMGDYGMSDNTGSGLPGPNLLSAVVTSSGSGKPVIASAQYGAGQIVATITGSANSINEYVGGINIYTNGDQAGNSGPYCGTSLDLAPTSDLKLMSDILAAADAHPAALQNSHQTGATADPVSSPSQIWKQPFASATGPTLTPAGATVYGNLAYVTVGSILTAYYIHPSQDPNPSSSLIAGNPWDIKWQVDVRTAISAPTVAVLPVISGGSTVLKPVVFVEKADGSVLGYDAAPPTTTGVLLTTLTNSGGRGSYGSVVPAPTYYYGSIYAGGADGSLFVYCFNPNHSTSSGVSYPLVSSSGTATAVTASPTVGIVPDGDGGNGNEIVALVPTSQYVYSVYLGAHGEKLGGAKPNYTTKLLSLANVGGKIDTAAGIPTTAHVTWDTYSLDANGLPVDVTGAVQPVSPNFTGFSGDPTTVTNGNDPVYADYDTLVTNSTGGSLTRVGVGVASSNDESAGGFAAGISAPALDRAGNCYFYGTIGSGTPSRLFSYHDAPGSGRTMNWCFQLPTGVSAGTVIDADGTDYAPLNGYQFVGAPVTDGQGNVYAMAKNGNATAILCFNTLTSLSADIFGQGLEGPVSGVQVVQPDPTNASQNLFGQSPIPNLTGNQITIGATGHIDFRNFATNGPAGGVSSGLYPNLAEPYPVAVQYNVGDVNQAGNQTPPQQTYARMHTNLAWYTIYGTGVSTTSGLTKAGNELYFVDTNGALDQVVADPQAEGITITSKFIAPTATGTNGSKMVTAVDTNAGVGTTVAAPSVSNGTMVLVGTAGVAAYSNQVTLVTDANRVLEMDSSGNAQWAVDATTRVSLQGGTTPIYSATGAIAPGQISTTTLELNRPSSLTELTPNDYLIADTGNNRCVRFDRAGRVIWELTNFTDDANVPALNKTQVLLKPGEPNTLNQPTSVQISTSQDAAGDTLVRYLISDSGNFRIVEVDDVYNASGQALVYHELAWVSHTHDIQGREYRYQSAAYFTNTAGSFIAALVTNKRVATLPANNGTTGALAPANQDGEGGSLVLLTYDPTNTAATNGFITTAFNSFSARIDGAGKFNATGGTLTSLNIRNPRYLKAYVPAGATGTSPKNLLLADDNGAWDLGLTTIAGKPAFLANFGFTQADYRAMQNSTGLFTPIDANGVTFNQGYVPRGQMPFLPASIQILAGTDSFVAPSGSVTFNRYLITNTYSQGEAANQIGSGAGTPVTYPGMAGEVFEVDHLANGAVVTGGYGSHTLSRPANTSPLSQPTFAYRLQ